MDFDETVGIIDSSKMSDFIACRRKYLLRHVFGWEPDTPEHNDREIGTAIHKALELISVKKSNCIDAAYALFLDEYRKTFPVETDGAFKKSPTAVKYTLETYIAQYQSDDYEVIDTEVCGSVPISLSPERRIYFKIDAVCKGKEGIFALEHKTLGRQISKIWLDSWFMRFQPTAYLHVLNTIYTIMNLPIYGVVINGIVIKDPPRLKKDGTPYANSTEPSHMRITVRKSLPQMNAWLLQTHMLFTELEQDLELVSSGKGVVNGVLLAFPQNTEHCSMYWGCPYIQLCQAWDNPLEMFDIVPYGFRKRFWNPREKEETAKRVIHV